MTKSDIRNNKLRGVKAVIADLMKDAIDNDKVAETDAYLEAYSCINEVLVSYGQFENRDA